jgi:hypothetical protein
MRCEWGCVTDPGSRLGLQLDFFMKLYLPEGVKPSSSNRSTSDALGLLCRQLGLLIRAGGRLHSPRRGFHLPDNRRYLDTSVPLQEPGHICENTHFWRSWRPSRRLSGHLVEPILSEFMRQMPLFGSTCGSSNARCGSSGEPAPPVIEGRDHEEIG